MSTAQLEEPVYTQLQLPLEWPVPTSYTVRVFVNMDRFPVEIIIGSDTFQTVTAAQNALAKVYKYLFDQKIVDEGNWNRESQPVRFTAIGATRKPGGRDNWHGSIRPNYKD